MRLIGLLKMRTLTIFLVVASFVLRGSEGVEVRDGETSFPLEAVKVLKTLLDLYAPVNPHLVGISTAAVCADPDLPEVFRPVCNGKRAAMVFSRLGDILMSPDPCEICANPSCFGCLI